MNRPILILPSAADLNQYSVEQTNRCGLLAVLHGSFYTVWEHGVVCNLSAHRLADRIVSQLATPPQLPEMMSAAPQPAAPQPAETNGAHIVDGSKLACSDVGHVGVHVGALSCTEPNIQEVVRVNPKVEQVLSSFAPDCVPKLVLVPVGTPKKVYQTHLDSGTLLIRALIDEMYRVSTPAGVSITTGLINALGCVRGHFPNDPDNAVTAFFVKNKRIDKGVLVWPLTSAPTEQRQTEMKEVVTEAEKLRIRRLHVPKVHKLPEKKQSLLNIAILVQPLTGRSRGANSALANGCKLAVRATRKAHWYKVTRSVGAKPERVSTHVLADYLQANLFAPASKLPKGTPAGHTAALCVDFIRRARTAVEAQIWPPELMAAGKARQ